MTSHSESQNGHSATQVISDRRAKVARLRHKGIEPYPHEFAEVESIESVLAANAHLEPGESRPAPCRIAGRLWARRDGGGTIFADIEDWTGEIQIYAETSKLPDKTVELFRTFDVGDLVGIDGRPARTHRGQLSVEIDDLTLLTKSLRPPPNRRTGLRDPEARRRHREAQLASSRKSRQVFVTRARVLSAVRRHLEAQGFLELETPILQPLYGGAHARPFVTEYNALNREFYLRIAPELYLKRALAGGLERVFEIGKDFRNESFSRKHNPEFTMLEAYEAYADYRLIAHRCETLVSHVAREIGYDGPLDFSTPWRRERLVDAIYRRTGVDILAHRTHESIVAAARINEITMDVESWAAAVDHLVTKHVEPTLIQPTFLLDYPIELSPLAKVHRKDPRLVERWECYAAGMEIGNAFTELNDPDEQRVRFEESREGREEAQPLDEDFLAALELGMPPAGGYGLGLDRLVMLMTEQSTIKDVILFPAMR